MGIFDFLFNKKKKKKVFVESNRTTNIKPKKKIIYDKEWESELIEMFKEDEKSDNPIWFFAQSKNKYNNVLLEALSVGEGKVNAKDIELDKKDAYNIENRQLLNNFSQLINKTEQLNISKAKTAFCGLLDIYIERIVLNGKTNNIYILSSLNSLFPNSNNNYYLSYILEMISDRKFHGKLYYLMQTYINWKDDIDSIIKDELLDLMSKENIVFEKENVLLFNTRDEISSYVETRRKQNLIKYNDKEVEDKYTGLVKTLLTSPEDDHYILLLFIYENVIGGNHQQNKNILTVLEKSVDIDYSVIHKIISLFIQKTYGSKIPPFSFIMRVLKKYFKNEPLDLNTYKKMKGLMYKVGSISKVQSINEFLFTKSESLYKMHSPEIHKLLHSGVIHYEMRGYNQYYLRGNKVTRNYLYDVLILISQVVPAIMVEEAKESEKQNIRIGNEELKIRPSDIKTINNTLFQQQVPYQLFNFHTIGNNSENFIISTLLVNSEQLNTLISYLNSNSNIYKYEQKQLSEIQFSEATEIVPELINNIKQITKAKNKLLSSNRFIHDIKWRDVKIKIVDNFPNRKKWYDIMHHIVSYSGSVKPSDTWLKKMEQLKETITDEEFELGIDRLNYDILLNEFWFNKDNLKTLRGLIWANCLLDTKSSCNHLDRILLRCYEKIPNIGPKSLSGASSCISALVFLDKPQSYKTLTRLKDETNYERFKNQLRGALNIFEKQSKMQVAILKEYTMNDFDFKKGEKILLIEHPFFVRWTIKNRKASSRWVDEKGNKLNKAPKLNIPDVKRKITKITKSINESIKAFDDRLDSYRFADVKWTVKEWKNNYLNHGLVKTLIERYLWVIEREETNTIVGTTLNDSLYDINIKQIELQDNDIIRPFHVSYVEKEIIHDWIDYYSKNISLLKSDYFYSLPFNLSEADDLLDKFSELNNEQSLGLNWNYVQSPKGQYFSKELLYINKIALASKDLESKNIKISYHNIPPKPKSKYRYSLEELDSPIDINLISEKIQLECINEIFLSAINRQSIRNSTFEKYMEIPHYRFIDNIFKKIQETNLINGYSYSEFKITIVGRINTYNIYLANKKQVIIEERKERNTYNFYGWDNPQRNYPVLLKIPFVPNRFINNIFGMIDQLSNDAEIKNARIKNWVEYKS